MMELTRALVLLIGVTLENMPADHPARGELAALFVILARRNRAGADEYNRGRLRDGAAAEVVLAEGVSPPHVPLASGEPHPDTVAFKDRQSEITDDELVEHGSQLLLLNRNQEL